MTFTRQTWFGHITPHDWWEWNDSLLTCCIYEVEELFFTSICRKLGENSTF